jgi:methylenetetrahydrofolate dehydrogenase (NADP+)/methenyltetrahydrofolate cyclohydrolase
MTAKLIDGKAIAEGIRSEIRAEIQKLPKGLQPGLAAVLVGDHAASAIYVRNKRKACDGVGIYSEEHHLPSDVSQEKLVNLIDSLNQSLKIHGILVQLPLPSHIQTEVILERVSPAKDVDGFQWVNMGRLMAGYPLFIPCTPFGIMKMLQYHQIPIEGKHAVVVGRSNIVGKPVAMLLLQKNATVTICHSRTKNLVEICREAEILIAAVGRAHMITGEMVREGAAVIDVGINRLETGKMVGDVEFESASRKAGWITPVPGGVGPMTIAMLLYNTLQSAKRIAGSTIPANPKRM